MFALGKGIPGAQVYSGLSTDAKPVVVGDGGAPVAVGSQYVESDTGAVYIFSRRGWQLFNPALAQEAADQSSTLAMIEAHLAEIKFLLQVALSDNQSA